MSNWAESSASAGRRMVWVPPQQRFDLVGEETGLPLVQCPMCNLARIIERRSGKPNENLGRVFFKCPRNAPWMRGRCYYYRWQKEYLDDLIRAKVIALRQTESGNGSGHLFEDVEQSDEGVTSNDEANARAVQPPRRVLLDGGHGAGQGNKSVMVPMVQAQALKMLMVVAVGLVGVLVGYLWKHL